MGGCLHDYFIINENNDGILEICNLCKKRNKVSKDRKTGKIDNRKYLKDHERDFIQRTDKRFEKIYGKPVDLNKQKEEALKKAREEAEETYEREKAKHLRQGTWKDIAK